MTKKYFQLTLEQRYQIEALKDAGHNQTYISIIVGVNKSTISREFKRNITPRGIGSKVYVAFRSQKKTDLRHHEKHKLILFSFDLKKKARKMMMIEKFSPELISAQWRKDGKLGVSHETIYNGYGNANLVTEKKMQKIRACTFI